MKLFRGTVLAVFSTLLMSVNGFAQTKNFPKVSPQDATADCKQMDEGWVVLYHIEIRAGLFGQKKRKPAIFVELGGNVHTGQWHEKDENVLVDWNTKNASWRFKLEEHASYERITFYPCRA